MGQWRIMISVVLALSVLICLCNAQEDANSGPENESEDYLVMHNCIRRVLGICPMDWDEGLAKSAKEWADQRKDCKMENSGRCGENMAAGPCVNGSWAVQMWLDERMDFDLVQNKCVKTCGHYTQIVWRNTKKVGCARVKCDPQDGENFLVVCHYDPPGNIPDEHPY